MKDIEVSNDTQGVNFIPGCGGTINVVALCGCTVDVACPAS